MTSEPAAPPAPRPPVLRPPASDAAARDTLEGRIKQAIQNANHYPEAARMMGTHGTVLVGFVYRDRSLSGVRILRSSSSPILDLEALRAVRAAVLPPPGEMAGKTLSLEVPVEFNLVTDDD